MRTPDTLELTFIGHIIPIFMIEIPDVCVQGFSDQRTSCYRSIRSGRLLIFVVSFEEDASVGCIEFGDVSVVDVVDKDRKEEMKMFPSYRSSIVVMVRGDIVEIIYSRLKVLEEMK